MDALAKHPEIIRKSQDFGGTELNPTVSVDQATFESVQLDENRNGEFHRSFSPRQVHVGPAKYWDLNITQSDTSTTRSSHWDPISEVEYS